MFELVCCLSCCWESNCCLESRPKQRDSITSTWYAQVVSTRILCHLWVRSCLRGKEREAIRNNEQSDWIELIELDEKSLTERTPFSQAVLFLRLNMDAYFWCLFVVGRYLQNVLVLYSSYTRGIPRLCKQSTAKCSNATFICGLLRFLKISNQLKSFAGSTLESLWRLWTKNWVDLFV